MNPAILGVQAHALDNACEPKPGYRPVGVVAQPCLASAPSGFDRWRRAVSLWGHLVKRQCREWRRRAASRAELARLSDRALADIRLSRAEAEHEVRKWWWES